MSRHHRCVGERPSLSGRGHQRRSVTFPSYTVPYTFPSSSIFICRHLQHLCPFLPVVDFFCSCILSLNHQILFDKLEHYGVRGRVLQFFQSYLEKRPQYVNINEHSSMIKPFRIGVPQGSILWPLLFIISINYLVNIDSSARFIMYADDTTLFFSSQDIVDLVTIANKALNTLERWSKKQLT